MRNTELILNKENVNLKFSRTVTIRTALASCKLHVKSACFNSLLRLKGTFREKHIIIFHRGKKKNYYNYNAPQNYHKGKRLVTSGKEHKPGTWSVKTKIKIFLKMGYISVERQSFWIQPSCVTLEVACRVLELGRCP